MEESRRLWYTPAEVQKLVFNGLVSISTVRNLCLCGKIPYERIGVAAADNCKPCRGRILIPASYVRAMRAKSEGMNYEATS